VIRVCKIKSLKRYFAAEARRGVARALLTLACFLLPMLLLSAREYLPGPVPATVLRVIDGDSLVVRATIWLGQEVETTVRLLGVDTPELRGKCSEERELAAHSRRLTAELAEQGSKVSLTEIQLGKFAARVTTSRGVDVGDALIEAGLGRAYHGGRRGSWCLHAGSDASPS